MLKRFCMLFAGILLAAGCGGTGGSAPAATTSTQSQSAQKAWVRAHLDDVYLWYNEIVDVPQDNYQTAPDYFNALLVKSKDRFSFSMPQAEAVSTFQDGMETGYGIRWGWAAPNRLFAYYVDPKSPSATSITRGSELLAINGIALSNQTQASFSEALFPKKAGARVSLSYRLPGSSTVLTNSFTPLTFSTTTVDQLQIIGSKVGYLLFNEHLATAEQNLINSMRYFQQQGVSELVLDMRYNGGGYLYIAEELASMIGGSSVQGKVFEKLIFNSKHPEKTNDPDNTYSFSNVDSKGNLLPMLGLSRVFVLTGSSTCSASESIINGLLPYMQVIRIGWTTCGKPYGFVPSSNSQQTYFALQFEGVNADNTDDYKSGFAPTCQVVDDLNYPLGHVYEARLSAALYYIHNNSCPTGPPISLPKGTTSNSLLLTGEEELIGLKPGLKLLKLAP